MWALLEFIGVALQLGEIVERIGTAQFGCVDQTHEEIADLGAFLRLIEKGILAMENRFLQASLANIVIKRGSGLSEKQRETIPVFEQVANGPAQARVGLDLLFFQLRRQPCRNWSISRPLCCW